MEAQGSTVITRERKGKDGKDGRGVTKVDVVYNTSTSNSVAPTDWFTDAPNMKKGDYLWSANDVYYTDGTNTIVGANVVTSADNVKTVVEQYNVNTSRTSAPSQNDSGWGTASPTATEGSYIWTRSKITYQNGEVEYTNPVCVTGNKGDSAVNYYITLSAKTFAADSTGKPLNTADNITVEAYKQAGNNSAVALSTANGDNWTISTYIRKNESNVSNYVSSNNDKLYIPAPSYAFNEIGVTFSVTINGTPQVYQQELIQPLKQGAQGKNGADGTNGTNGGQLEIRRHENGFAANYQYFNGTTKQSDSNVFFLDYVFVENSQATSGYDVYRCIKNVIYPSAPTSYATDGNWQSVATNETDAYFNYILAKGAYLKFLQSNGILVMKADGTTVNVALGGGDYPLWIGSSTYTDAPFKVSKDGKVYASDADVTGCVNAKSGHIGSFAISDEADMIAKNSDKTIGMLLSYNLIRFTDDNNGVSVYMGSTTTPSYLPYWKIPLQISNTRTYENQSLPGANLGISLDVSGCKAYDDVVYSGSHSLYIPHGDVCGFRKRTRRLTGGTGTSKITLDKLDSNVIIAQNDSIEIVLSHNVEDGQEYFIIVPPYAYNHDYVSSFVDIDANNTDYKFYRISNNECLKYIKCIFDKVNNKWYIFEKY